MAGHEQHYILPRAEFDKPVKLLIVVVALLQGHRGQYGRGRCH